MTAERQKETKVERAYSSSTDGSAQVNLASARCPAAPSTGPVLGFVAALMAGGLALMGRNGGSTSEPASQRSQADPARGPYGRRRRRGPR